ncbi:cell wall-binding repeat-containing protein [Candidatus Poriferisodalis sp.]|uniref:cell wall-binding repeat-containing protein n=1 Tax=Candidatus Poriferisodalis sp. TaxID=3101277 RepID=UPI003AF94444
MAERLRGAMPPQPSAGSSAEVRSTATIMFAHDAPTPHRAMRAARAFVALIVAAGVLAVAHSPAQGAATYAESRRLEGLTRFETAIDIAEAYIDDVETLAEGSSVDTVILTSGADEHFAYAVPVPVLSRLHHAPLLLTRPNRLPHSVATFLEDNDIATVIIVGGESVVNSSVEESLSLLGDIEVSRIGGADPYSTAAALAEQVGESATPGEFSVDGRTALLATGENFADALAAGPLAYRGNHPILLTRSAELPEATELYFEASGIEHVVILGGAAAVSTGVEQAIIELGIEITRWGGADRFGTAVRIAEALLGVDTPAECFDGAELGLAYGRRSPDAIVSGPLLGELCAPLLLTEFDELPSSVADLLRSDDYVTGDINGDVRLNVFGGVGAVADQAVTEAVEAVQLPELRANVSGMEGGCHFTVEFSEPVLTSDAANFSNYSTGQGRFGSVDAGSGFTTARATVTFSGAIVSPGGAVPADCFAPLQERERIGVASRAIRSAAGDRTVAQGSYSILSDNSRPTFKISAPQGASMVWVHSSEPLSASDIEILFERNRVPEVTYPAAVESGVAMFAVEVPQELDAELRAGDRVSIASRAATDLAGNESRATRRTVEHDETSPQVARITVTEFVATRQAAVTLSAVDAGGRTADAILISANVGTSVDGAAGNQWQIDVNVRDAHPRSWSPSQLSAVRVSESSRRILVVVLADAVADDLVADLNGDRAFSSRFSALTYSGEGSARPADTRGRVSFEGGASIVDLGVLWTEPVHGCGPTRRAVTPRSIEIDVDGDGEADFSLDGHAFSDSDVMIVPDDEHPASLGEEGAVCDETPGVPSGTLVARIESSSVDNLPNTESQATVRLGAATDFANNDNATQTGVKFRRP